MTQLSRRQLARYAVTQLIDGQPARQISRSLAAALVKSKKQDEADLLIGDIYHELEDRGMLAYATVTSAHKLSAALRMNLKAKIKKAAAVSDVILDEQVDKKVIGGIKIETEKHAWDETLIRRLSDIKGGI